MVKGKRERLICPTPPLKPAAKTQNLKPETTKHKVMPNPKWRHSKRRKRARRTHYKTEAPQIATCTTTGERHLFHHAFRLDGALYYRGQVVIPAKEVAEADA